MVRIHLNQLLTGWRIKLSTGGSSTFRHEVRKLYRILETRIPKLIKRYKGQKLCIRVHYLDGAPNETVDSTNPNYLLWALLCFLEDFLSGDMIFHKTKKYKHLAEPE